MDEKIYDEIKSTYDGLKLIKIWLQVSLDWVQEKELLFYAMVNPERYMELKSMPYKQYLNSPEWTERRNYEIKKAKSRCQLCGKYSDKLNVHHNNYESRGHEMPQDLIVLCEDCHRKFHNVEGE